MFSKLFQKRREPILVGNVMPAGEAGIGQGFNAEDSMLPTRLSAQTDVIERLEKVPQHQALLTSSSGKSMVRISGKLEFSIAVIELGPQRAAILFDPDLREAELAETLRLIRNKLKVDNYVLQAPDLPCRPAVIKALVDEHRARMDDGDEDDAVSKSKAKELWDKIIEIGVQQGASDFHFQIVRNRAEVQIRVDGELEPLPDGQNGVYIASQIQRAIGWAFSNNSQAAANSASLYNKDLNLYTMIKPRMVGGKQISLRYQHLVGAFGPKAVCRVLHTDLEAPTLSFEELGYYTSHIKIWREVARTPTGLILIAGTTGSGKTTALKTFIETHPGNGSSAFYSLENPIEYPLKGVHQIPFQIDLLNKTESTKKYAEVIASMMRSDPDGALIGEIRDPASAMAAQQLSETGHMAAATLHAHLLSGIIPRLTDDEIGMSRHVLTNPNMVALLVYQALVPRVCQHCRINGADYGQIKQAMHSANIGERAEEATAEHVAYVLHQLEKRFGLGRENFYFKRQGGCPDCRHRGTKGQTVVAEMMIPDQKWLDHIRNGEDHEALRHYRSFSDGRPDSDDMTGKTVFEHAMHKALLGEIDPRECERFDSFRRFQTAGEVAHARH